MTKPEPHNIFLFKEQISIGCDEHTSILQATLGADIIHTHACGGQAKCSTCRVSIMEGIENCNPRNDAEQQMANMLNFPNEVRLACQTRVNGDISIRRMVSDKLDIDIITEQFEEESAAAIGRQQKLTIVFTDIINYTAFAEKFPPYDIVHVLNRYYRMMNSSIQKNNGFISDVAGDGILAIFGLDDKQSNSVMNATEAIKSMHENLILFNNYLEENFNIKFGMRAGIHYGDVIVGPFDTGDMKKIAVIGDNVNYASRIESANKDLNTNMLYSEEAYQQIRQKYPNFNLYTTSLKGKTGEYKLFEILQ